MVICFPVFPAVLAGAIYALESSVNLAGEKMHVSEDEGGNVRRQRLRFFGHLIVL